MATSASYYFRANFNFVIDGYEDTTGGSKCVFTATSGGKCVFTATSGGKCVFTATSGGKWPKLSLLFYQAVYCFTKKLNKTQKQCNNDTFS